MSQQVVPLMPRFGDEITTRYKEPLTPTMKRALLALVIFFHVGGGWALTQVEPALVLLVIFIVTAPLLTHAVKLDLPKATSNADIQKPEKVEFAIDAQGALYWNGERLGREEAMTRFREAGQKRPQPEIYLRADQNCLTAMSPRCWPMPPRAGLSKVAFVSEPVR